MIAIIVFMYLSILVLQSDPNAKEKKGALTSKNSNSHFEKRPSCPLTFFVYVLFNTSLGLSTSISSEGGELSGKADDRQLRE